MGIGEDLLDRKVEGGGDPEGEIERGIVALGLERVDRLARDPDRRRELLLGPAAFGAKDPKPAPHARELRIRGVTIPNAPQKKG